MPTYIMSLNDLINRLWSKTASSDAVTKCPQESDLLAYIENRLSIKKSDRLEGHFVSCDDCRESLTLFARISSDQTASEPVSSQEIKDQTASVIALIKQQEFDRRLRPQPARFGGKAPISWHLAAAAAAVLIITISAGVWFLNRPSETERAMESIALAMKDERHLEARLSGSIEWSRYSTVRGPETSLKQQARLQLEHAQTLLDFAEYSSAPAEARILLARTYLAGGSREGAQRALTILRELESRGQLTAEALNDTGVALFQLENYDEAISYFSKALESRPDFNESLFNRALAGYKAARYDDSRRDWEEFINKSSDHGWKQEAQRYLQLLDTSRQGIRF